MPRFQRASLRAFTLIELSLVVLILGLLTAAAMRYVNATNDANLIAQTNATLDVIDTALQNYRNNFGQLPCPADITVGENTQAFGVQTDTLADGNCTSSNNLFNTYTPPPDFSDPNYDSATLGQVVQGAVPTKTLRIDDRYAYDAWGNKIFYVVDMRYTKLQAFTSTYPATSHVGAVVVLKTSTDALANALSGTLINNISYNAVYALVSTGENRHGGYPRNTTTASSTTRFNASSTNTDELENCHCNSSGTTTSPTVNFNRIFVQKPKTNDSTTFNDNFDDIVRFKTRSDMLNTTEMQ